MAEMRGKGQHQCAGKQGYSSFTLLWGISPLVLGILGTAGQTGALSQGTLCPLPFTLAVQEPSSWIYPNAMALKFWEREERRLCLTSRSLLGLQSLLDSSQDKIRFP